MLMFEGRKLIEIRETLGLSRKEFAERLGVTVACLCRWEKDQRLPRRANLIALNKANDDAEAKKRGLVLAT